MDEEDEDMLRSKLDPEFYDDFEHSDDEEDPSAAQGGAAVGAPPEDQRSTGSGDDEEVPKQKRPAGFMIGDNIQQDSMKMPYQTKKKSKMELLDEHLEKVRRRDEYYFDVKSKPKQVETVNFNHNEDDINGVFELDYAALEA